MAWLDGRIHTVTDPAGLTTTYTYDTAGNLVTVTDGGDRTTTFGYDAAHQLTDITDPYGNHTHNVYTAGQVTEQTDPAGLVTTLVYAGTPMGDGNGNAGTTTMTDGHGAVTRAPVPADAAGRHHHRLRHDRGRDHDVRV